VVVISEINYCPSIISKIPYQRSSAQVNLKTPKTGYHLQRSDLKGFYFNEDQESISHKHRIGKSYGQLFLATAVRSLMSNRLTRTTTASRSSGNVHWPFPVRLRQSQPSTPLRNDKPALPWSFQTSSRGYPPPISEQNNGGQAAASLPLLQGPDSCDLGLDSVWKSIEALVALPI